MAKSKPAATTTEEILAALQKADAERAALIDILSKQHAQRPVSNQAHLSVGIRNVSSYTISLSGSPVPHEPAVDLYAERGGPNPNSVAIVSYPWWQQLRRSKWYNRGMIIRDDSILGEAHPRAPEDRPEELAPDHAKNVILDPHQFIESRNEEQLREDIAKITSEESLRRLWAAVDAQVGKVREKIVSTEAGKALPGTVREQRAVQGLPAMYKLAEELVSNRLHELGPVREY